MYQRIVKPLFDRLLALLLLLAISPLLLLVAVTIWVSMGRPIFFSQRRPGKDATIFSIYKFRTMTNDQKEGVLLPDEMRLKGVGKLIRSLSLDELPQLWNVLKGEMSFIGPRPLLPEYLPLYNDEQKKRHDVKPGVTGWAQVNGRNAISWEKKFACDVYYVEHLSFALDVKIVWMTVRKVLLREGVSAEGEATTTPFRGNEK